MKSNINCVNMKTLADRIYVSGHLYSICFINYFTGVILSCAINKDCIDEATTIRDIIANGDCNFYTGEADDYDSELNREPLKTSNQLMLNVIDNSPGTNVMSIVYDHVISALNITYKFSACYTEKITNKDFRLMLSIGSYYDDEQGRFRLERVDEEEHMLEILNGIYDPDKTPIIPIGAVSLHIDHDLHVGFNFYAGDEPTDPNVVRSTTDSALKIHEEEMKEKRERRYIPSVLKNYTASDFWTNIARNHRHIIKRRA